MKHGNILFIAVLILLGAVLGLPASCGERNSRPNILLVTLDTTRADHLGCYGYGKPTTPNIDKLAADGVRFEKAIAQAAVTPVSHASILTGLYPFEHGLRVLHGATNYRLEKGAHETLATFFKGKGWHTGAFVSAFPVSEYFGFQYGFDVFDSGIGGDVEKKMVIDGEGRANWAVSKNQRRADATTDKAIAWLDGVRDPFFMWVHYFDPHDTTLCPPQSFIREHLTGFNRMSREDQVRAMYDVEVTFMDRELGRLLDHLRDTGRFDDTIIVVTNDHGEGLGDHDWWFHRILYQEQIHMPLIVHLPGGPRGTSVPDLVRSIDIMPTIIDYAGFEPPPVTGKSLRGLIEGKKEPPRIAYADALIRLDDNRPRHAENTVNDDLMYCVIEGPWKLIHRRFHRDASELYRLDRDPHETRNVITEYPDKEKELFRFLEQPGIMIDKLIPPAPESEATKRLKELGYTH